MNVPEEVTSAEYIVVGGGTSGLVVANRLTEDPDINVIVIEAGPNRMEDPQVNVPGFWTTLLGSEVDWKFESICQAGLGGRSTKEAQGKLLGGSSALNGQAFIAPSRVDIDAWAKLGSTGWDWAGLAPYYKKCYTLTPPSSQEVAEHLGVNWIDEEYRGSSGPLKVSFPGVVENPLCKGWIDAFRGLDRLTTGDPFSGNSIGGYSNAATVDSDTKTRSYSGSAYGNPAILRPNFHLVTEATVHKILFKSASSKITATGVLASVQGHNKTFHATKEIILAAGVFNTPKLLELSGVGNKKLLAKHGIPLLVNNPGVGENLQDHLMTGVSFEVVDGITTADPLLRQEPEALNQAQRLYFEPNEGRHRSGPLTIGGMQSHAFMPVLEFANVGSQILQRQLLDRFPPKPVDMEYYNVIRSIIEDPNECSAAWFMFLAQVNLHEEGKSFVGSNLLQGNFASLGCSQSHPFSRGSSHISSADVRDKPLIDPNYFSNPADLEILARHVQSLETLRHTKGLASYFKPDGRRNHPDAFNINNLEGAKKYTLDTAVTTYHNCGTAAMLPRDKGGVVDENLLVYGAKGLRIVDASIIPLIPRGNIMSTVYAVAEKAADIIKGV